MTEHKLFTFMKDDNRVYIASLTLEDAISALHELENISNVKYDVKNYLIKYVNIFPILNLDETYSDLPYILTEHQYKVVVSYLFDHKYPHLMTKKVVETKLLTEKYSNLMNDIDEVEEKNKNTNKTKLIVDNALSMLQNKIKGED